MTEKLEMRELKSDDVFKIMNVIEKLDVFDELSEMVELFTGGSQEVHDMRNAVILKLTEQGIKEEDITDEMILQDPAAKKLNASILPKIIKMVVKNIPKAKKEINSLLADLCEVDLKVIKDLSLSAYLGLVKDFFKQPELGKLLELVGELK